MIACLFCGVEFQSGYGRKYCADVCKSRAKERKRVAAGHYKRPEVRARQRTYSAMRYRALSDSGVIDAPLLRHWSGLGVSSLAEARLVTSCMVDGCLKDVFARLFCREHYHDFMLSEGCEWASGYKYAGNDYRARAERYGVAYEVFSRTSIFLRDGWLCGICGQIVDSGLAYPDPMSVSLDHVVPLSRGGAHTAENTQCAHLICNVKKGASGG